MAHRNFLLIHMTHDCEFADLYSQYWVTYAFLTVIESAISAVYWFPFYYTFKFILVLWMALPQTG